MKFDFTTYVAGERDDEVTRTFSPALDFNNYEDLAITLWVWTNDPNNTISYLASKRASRLKEIILDDGSARVGRFTVLPLKNIGWNKVIAPLRNFIWKAGISVIDPNEVDWDDITKIRLFARTEHAADHNAIYLDDMQLEWAPPQPSRPYQLASFDDINDELWEEDHGNSLMLQTPGGDPNFWREGTGSMMIDFSNHGPSDWDIRPVMTFIPALDFTDGNDWAITLWVWTDLVLDAYLWEIALHDVCGNVGRSRVPRADINTGYGWNKITVRIDEFLWSDGGDFANKTSSEVCLDAIVLLKLWTMSFPYWGNSLYLDDLRIEPAVKAPSEAGVYNADRGTITVDGDASDWAGLSEPIDFDLATINYEEPSWADPYAGASPWPHTGTGDLHVKYRLAWDPNYLYILVEEQSGDNLANEAANVSQLMAGGLNAAGTFFDSLALAFDFTNNRKPGDQMHVSLWLWLGLNSSGVTDLMGSLINQDRVNHDGAPLVNGSAATSGALGSRVIEAKLKWSVLESAIDPWFQPVFGCDPRLLDTESTAAPWNATHSMGWLSGVGDPVGWPQGYYRWPTGRDTYSRDIRLCPPIGDLDGDCDVDFADYALFAAKWLDSGCGICGPTTG
jgi:hypothetical protein